MTASMTAFGIGKVKVEFGTVNIELRSVNSRFLDIQFRMPDELRLAEQPIREKITQFVARGKVEVRASFQRSAKDTSERLSTETLNHIASQLAIVQKQLPNTPSPSLTELLAWSEPNLTTTPESWTAACLSATDIALDELLTGRKREGQRLVQAMLSTAQEIEGIVAQVRQHLPELVANYQERLALKLKDTLTNAFPNGFSHIAPSELFERISSESSLFAMRIDVAEELARLASHLDELVYLLTHGRTPSDSKIKIKQVQTSGIGKRLDFLFQEMNREANTLGSKSASMDMTRAAMDLKLLIEQMREQAQNIE